ncbi:hypothetical protein E1B28_005032 [Marasmius oreades]|uniref:Uncharacterized protein n=1 Tax=Marasmius oreades TaxID=181124 RepID=A0A9P8ADQ0_9AGAR|nr:uncharacterized protein E1B28_005032 [Marasmius oreades]KAG7097708.1 hypothetical protein E1B28_005032 [Marasmius oreades]
MYPRPAEKLPKDPEFGFENWDDPEGAVEWNRMANYLIELKETGVFGEHHSVGDDVVSKWKSTARQNANPGARILSMLPRLGERPAPTTRLASLDF